MVLPRTWAGDGESVVQTVSYQRTVGGGAAHRAGGGAAGEGRGQLHGCEVQPDLVDQGVALADGVDTGGGGEVGGEVGAVLQGPPATLGREGATHSESSSTHSGGDPTPL